MARYHPHLKTEAAGEKGRGVFATAPIKQGELIARMSGWLAKTSELDDDWFALQVDHDLWLCSHGDQLDDCINHSCEPNAGFLTGETVLFALRDIASGEEITFDYATSLAEPGWTLECCCGAACCRKLVRSWLDEAEGYRRSKRHIALTYLRLG